MGIFEVEHKYIQYISNENLSWRGLPNACIFWISDKLRLFFLTIGNARVIKAKINDLIQLCRYYFMFYINFVVNQYLSNYLYVKLLGLEDLNGI